jgi:hypothetical protein
VLTWALADGGDVMPRCPWTSWGLGLVLALALLVTQHDARAVGTTGGLKVTSNPSGATVLIDGKSFGTTPLLTEVPVGTRTVEVTRSGYQSVKKKITVAADKISRVEVALSPKKHKATNKTVTDDIRIHDTKDGGKDAGPGTVTVVTTPPGLTVFLDEYYIPQPTPVAFDVGAGIYELKVEQEGEIVYRKTVFVQAGRTLDLDLVIKKTRKIDYSDPWK